MGASYDRATQVAGLESGIAAISSSSAHSCALTTTGGVKCWGANFLGQLGRGTFAASAGGAADVVDLASGVIDVATNEGTSCAVTSGNGVKCWGYSTSGFASSAVPVDKSGISGALKIAGGGTRFCALITGNVLKCWHVNDEGYGIAPQQVAGLPADVIKVVMSGAHTCVLTAANQAHCWGFNDLGQVGDGTRNASSSPVDITTNSGALSDISVGSTHTCAVTVGGAALCWGDNAHGQLGNDVNHNRFTPVDVQGLNAGVGKLGAGTISCALTQAGGVKCWGGNYIGNGTASSYRTPTDVTGLSSGNTLVATRGYTSCALTAAGAVKCWGTSSYNQFGTGQYTAETPVDVTGFGIGVTSIAIGDGFLCAVVSGGGAKCAGNNYDGQLGNNSSGNQGPVGDVHGLTAGYQSVVAGARHACALSVGGAVKCWGKNDAGQLGDGTKTSRTAPVDVVSLNSGVTAISAQGNRTCALRNDGMVKCWGQNVLGDGTATSREVPTDVAGLGDAATQVSVGNDHICALLTGGQAKCWGSNQFRQLGTGSDLPRRAYSPVDVPGLSNAISIESGNRHSCAIVAGGGVKCWGFNSLGQVGDGTDASALLPVAVLKSAALPVPARTDFNLDGRSDILWHNASTGMVYEMQMNGLAVSAAAVIDQRSDLNWSVAATAPLRNTAFSYYWHNQATGEVYGVVMDGTVKLSERSVYVEPNTSWKIVGSGDFDGNGYTSLLWRNVSTGDLFVLKLEGTFASGGAVIYSEPNMNWQTQQVADFNGDGFADVLWRNTATGDVFMMLMNGTTVAGGGVIYSEPNAAWQIQAAADFNGDGRADILWRNTATGDVYMMLMNGTTITGGSVFYGEPNADWKIVATGDNNGDGRADILWRNTATGQVFMMLMDGFTISGGGFVYTEPDQNWKIVGP
jgi:alpha-tubulin suppressor-like RCC1 family protein